MGYLPIFCNPKFNINIFLNIKTSNKLKQNITTKASSEC